MIFPKHKCSLHLTHNQHKCYYEKIERYLFDREGMSPPHWQSEEHKTRAIATDELWELQWYPDTPVGSYAIYAPTLVELLAFAKEVAGEESFENPNPL